MYLKIFKKNFVRFDEELGNVIEARLVPVGLRLIRWHRGEILWEKDWRPEYIVPDGCHLSYDVELKINGYLHRLSIHSATAIRDFQPYLAELEKAGKRLEDVVTRMTITSRRKVNPSVRFVAVG